MGKNPEEKTRVKSGLTSTSFIALLYAIFIFQPAILWLHLSSGTTLAGLVNWVTLIVFVEITKVFGKPLRKQEAAIIYLLSGMGWSGMGAPFFIDQIYRSYYAHSEIAALFGMQGKIPAWWASLDNRVFIARTFLDPTWLMPLFFSISVLLTSMLSNIFMGLLMRHIFVKSMNLPFPIQEIQTAGIINVTEQAGKQKTVLLFGSIAAMAYTFILYGPSFINNILGYPTEAPPVPWAELSEGVQTFLPGACFGIATDLLVLVTGFILPTSVTISIFIGSSLLYLVANPLLVHFDLTLFARDYFKGMTVAQIMYRSNLYAWAGPLVAVSLSAGLVSLLAKRRAIAEAIRALVKVKASREFSLFLLIFLWMIGAVLSVVISYALAPVGIAYFLLMLIMALGWSLLWNLVNTYSVGITGLNLTSDINAFDNIIKFSYIRLSGVTTFDVWYTGPSIGVAGTAWCSTFRVIDYCDCDVRSYLKAFLMLLPILFISGFIYVQIFWSLSPMPSFLYKYTSINWPIRALSWSMWITGEMFQAFDMSWIIGAFLLTAAFATVVNIAHIPISIIGLAAGLSTPLPNAFTIFAGCILAKILINRLGSKWWKENRLILAAGISIGEATVLVILSAIFILSKSLWVLAY